MMKIILKHRSYFFINKIQDEIHIADKLQELLEFLFDALIFNGM